MIKTTIPGSAKKKITALIPCYNEENGIGNVIESFPTDRIRAHGYDLDIVVIDNNSTDATAEVARAHGAIVLCVPSRGKGNAIRFGFRNISKDTDYVVMLDGDTTYKPDEILRLIEPLDSGFCSVVIGSRLGGKILYGSMSQFNRLGNWMYSHLVRYFYHVNVTDVLTGYFAWKREAVERLLPHLQSEGFAIEMEMVTKMAKLGEEIYSVPISYDKRVGRTNLRPIYDGMRILLMFLKNLTWSPRTQENRKKFAVVSDAIYPFNKGGKEKRIYDITTRLAAQGADVTVYCMQWWKGGKIIAQDGVKLCAISPYYPLYAGDRRSIKEAIFFALHCLKLLGKSFDVIEVDHMPHFAIFTVKLVCILKRKQMFVVWHEVWGKEYWKKYLGVMGALAYWIEKISAKLPDTIVSVSYHTTHDLRNVLKVEKEVITITNGLDVEGITKNAPAKAGADVLFAGRLLPNKNVDILLRALAILTKTNPGVSAFIVGEGPEKKNLISLAAELGLQKHISFLDFSENHDDLYRVMRASRVFVLPSTREGFGIAVLEANACGLPVVTINHKHNAAKELIINGENGVLTTLNEIRLADAIKQSLNMKKDRMAYRRYAEKYDWRHIMPVIKKIYAL